MVDSTATDGQDSGGFSRREVISKSVVAGGLIWASPVVLSGRAGAAVTCCDVGTPVTIKVAEQTGVNCGVACISQRGSTNYDCPSDLVECFDDLDLVVGDFTSGGADTARIVLAAGLSVITAAAKAGSNCYYADCPTPATSQTDSTNPNTCLGSAGGGGACTFRASETPLPPAAGGKNRVWLTAGTGAEAGKTIVNVNTHPDGQLNHVELSLCVSPAVTGICP